MDRQSGLIVVAVATAAGVCTSLLTNFLLKKKTTDNTVSPSNILELIQTRRSIFPKQYTGKAVSRVIILEMLEAARWAPTHHLTEPWEFVVLESLESRTEFGTFLAESYKESCTKSGKPFSQKKYDKKFTNAQNKASHVIAICVRVSNTTNPLVEEICSVAMAVQNMFLVATAHGVGSYWSSGGVYQDKSTPMVENPVRLKEFLNIDKDCVCLGWVFVGDFHGNDEKNKARSWPTGRRKPLDDRLTWR